MPMRPSRVGTQLLCIGSMILAACKAIPNPPDSTPIALFKVPSAPVADGSTLMPIQITVDAGVTGAARAIALGVSAGTINGKTDLSIMPDSSGVDTLYLRPPRDPGPVVITATVDGVTMVRTVTFVAAVADSIFMTSSALTVSGVGDAVLSLTIMLTRASGLPSHGAAVQFSIGDPDSLARHGSFSRPLPSDSNGKVLAQYTPGDIAASGTVTLMVATLNQAGDSIHASLPISIAGRLRATSAAGAH